MESRGPGRVREVRDLHPGRELLKNLVAQAAAATRHAIAGYRLPVAYPVQVFAWTLLVLPVVSAAAAWIPARHAAALPAAEALARD